MRARHPNEAAGSSRRGRLFRACGVAWIALWAAACQAAEENAVASTPGSSVLAGWGGWLLCVAFGTVWAWERSRRRRADAKLVSANERLRILFDESPLSICLFDPNDREVPYRIIECNQYACDLHGYTRDELIGKSMGVLTPLEVTYESVQHFLATMREGTVRGETHHKRKDGTVFFIEYVSRLVVIEGREYVLGADRDLTAERARRASEEHLRDTAELNQLVLRASNDGVWDWHVGPNQITYSQRCRDMLGYAPDEMPDGDPAWLEIIHPEDRGLRAELLRRHWEEGVPYIFQFRARHKDGNWRWIISRGITLFDAERRPVRMVGCRTDITELKRIDAELLQSRKLRAVGEMVGGIAHEFNNLLTPMLLHAEMLGAQFEHDRRVAGHLGPIRTGIDRARELTQRILTFGRRSTDARELLDLEEVVRDNLAFLGQTIERRIKIEVRTPPVRAAVWANRGDLSQLVVNLVLNARDTLQEKEATSPSGSWAPRVELLIDRVTRASGARDSGDRHTPLAWHRLTVRDNGLGISEELRERVFEPFFTTKEVGRGTGLGLATAWHIATAMGGWIDIESTAGEGSSFHVYMPAATGEPGMAAPEKVEERKDGVAGTQLARPPMPESAASAESARGRVLLIEDNDIVRFATEQLIASFGHAVESVTDGAAAWQKVQAQPGRYDIVFSDLNVPAMNGVELVKRLRGSGFPGKIVVYSGYFSTADQAQLEVMKVDLLLPKPFMRAQLASVLG